MQLPQSLGGRAPGNAARTASERPAGGHCRVAWGSLLAAVRPTGRTSGPICHEEFGRLRPGPTAACRPNFSPRGQALPVDDGALEPAIRLQRVIGNDPGPYIAQFLIE